MENKPENVSPRRKQWPNRNIVREVSGDGPVKRKYLSNKFENKEKLEKPIRMEIKGIAKEQALAEMGQQDEVQSVPTKPDMASQVEEMVNSITPKSEDEFFAIWSKNNRLDSMGQNFEEKFRTEFDKWISQPENKIDFSEKTVSRIKEIVSSAINESARFKQAVQKFGFPIIVAKTESAERASLTKMGDPEATESEIGVTSDAFTTSMCFMPSVINSIYDNGDKPDTTLTSSRSTTPKMGDPLIDPTINGQIRHEWSHYLIADALNDSERVNRNNNLKSKPGIKLFNIAEKYMSDSTMMQLLDKEFSETANTPRTITRYAHANMFEMFAEGMSAYLHPDTSFERFVMNAALRKDIKDALGE